MWRQGLRDQRFVALAVMLLGLCLLLFVWIADEVHGQEHLPLENRILQTFRTGDPLRPIGPAWAVEVARDLTALGSVAVLSGVVALAIGYLLLSQRRAAALFLVVTSAGGAAVNSALKHAFDRQRPALGLRLVDIDSFSFPSGHAMSSATIYLTLAVLLSQLATRGRQKVYLLVAALALTGAVGLTRVYLGVHYPSDVLAGWAAGTAWALLCWLVAHGLGRRRLERRATPAVAGRPGRTAS